MSFLYGALCMIVTFVFLLVYLNMILYSCLYDFCMFARLHNLVTSRQQDKQTIASMEKKLTEERKLRTNAEQQLANEKKNKSVEAAAAAARAVAMAAATRLVTRDMCSCLT